ncbi:MAG: BatD family protein [Planctomycetota bacterium]
MIPSIALAPLGRADDDKSKDPIRVRAEAAADKTAIKIGERFIYTITITADEGITTVLPEIPKDLGPFAVLDVKRETPVIDANGKTTAKVVCILTTYELGKPVIPATDVKYDLKDGSRGVTTTEAVVVDVVSALPPGEKMKDIRDIRGIYDFSPSPREQPREASALLIILLALVILLIAALTLGAYLSWRRTDQARLLLPHEFALAEIERLRNSDLIAKGKIKEFHYRLSLIARRYVESRFGLRAPDRTTEEFLQELAKTNLLRASEKALLEDLLRQCDLAKFAKHRPDPLRSSTALDGAVEFVHLTKPQPAVQGGKAA